MATASKSSSGNHGQNRPVWMYPEIAGSNPPERWGHSACMFEGKLYVFGGCRAGLHFSDVLTLDLRTMAWSSLTSTGEQPGPRDSHTAILYGSKMVIFGGTNGSKRNNDVHILDLETLIWSQPSVEGDPPCPRESHTATLISENKMLVFGGSGEGDCNYLNDIHVLELDSMRWTSPIVTGDLPRRRDSHTAVIVGNQLIVYGGDCGDRYLGNIDVLNLENFTWSKLETASSSGPGLRAGHIAITVGLKVYIFGGVGDGTYFSDVWMLDVSGPTWSRIDVAGSQPQGRFSHVATLIDDNILFYGGCGEEERPLDECVTLHLGREKFILGSPMFRLSRTVSDSEKLKRIKCVAAEPLDRVPSSSSEIIRTNLLRRDEMFKHTNGVKAENGVHSLKSSCPLNIPGLTDDRIKTTVPALCSGSSDALQSTRLRKGLLPYIEASLAPENDHVKRRKTLPFMEKLEVADSEQDNQSQHSSDSPSKSEQEQTSHKLLPKFLSSTFSTTSSGFPVKHQTTELHQQKCQQRQFCVQKIPQQSPQFQILSKVVDQEHQRVAAPNFPLQVHIQAHQAISVPINGHGPHVQSIKPQDELNRTFAQKTEASALSEKQQKCTVAGVPMTPKLVGYEVRGVVDGVFESGYLMSARFNGQVLRGILFSPGPIYNMERKFKTSSNGPTMARPMPIVVPGGSTTSNTTMVGYPVFPNVHVGNTYSYAHGEPLTISRIDAGNISSSDKQINAGYESQSNGMPKGSPTGVVDGTQSVPLHMSSTSVRPQFEVAECPTGISGQEGRWVWQPTSTSASTSSTWNCQYASPHSTENVVLAMPAFQSFAFSANHSRDEPSTRSNGGGSSNDSGSPNGVESTADLQPGMMLSLGGPGQAAYAIASRKS